MRQLAVVLLALVISLPALAADGIVRTKGAAFELDGKPFVPVGVNNHYLTYGSPFEVTRVMDDAAAMGSNVVRTYLQPVIGSLDGTTVPTIWDYGAKVSSNDLGVNGHYVLYWDTKTDSMGINDGPNGLGRLDQLVAKAKQRNLRLLIAFMDFWAYTGGMQQMAAWYGSPDKNTFVFADPRPRADYKRFVKHVLERVNPYTGVAYKDEPAIFAWELANEPNIEPKNLVVRWVDEMVSHIKSIDKKHMVATGRGNIDVPPLEAPVKAIDMFVVHPYPVHTGLTPRQVEGVLTKLCAFGHKVGKPVLLEEFGYARKHKDQVEVYRRWLDLIERTPGCSGWLVWRLLSPQDDGTLPPDTYDQFDVHNDGGPLWTLLRDKARAASRAH